jgi:membrane protein implicated in regulation of membrane protease activity
MTNHLVRLHAAAASIIVFFLLWTLIAAHPWEATSAAPWVLGLYLGAIGSVVTATVFRALVPPPKAERRHELATE